MTDKGFDCPSSKYKYGNSIFGSPYCLDGEYTCDAGTSKALCLRCWKENTEKYSKKKHVKK